MGFIKSYNSMDTQTDRQPYSRASEERRSGPTWQKCSYLSEDGVVLHHKPVAWFSDTLAGIREMVGEQGVLPLMNTHFPR